MVVLKCFYKLIDNLLGIFQRITLLKVSKISTILKYPFTLRVIKRQIASVQYRLQDFYRAKQLYCCYKPQFYTIGNRFIYREKYTIENKRKKLIIQNVEFRIS